MINSSQTVGNVISSLLPGGSQEPPIRPPEDHTDKENCQFCPMFPTDVFGVAAYLCKVGGVISFFDPSPYAEVTDNCHFKLTTKQRKMADRAAEKWRERNRDDLGQPPKFVEFLWACLIKSWDEKVTPGQYLSKAEGAPDWWRAALLLTMISDMACNRLLRDPLGDYDPSPFEEWLKNLYFEQFQNEEDDEVDDLLPSGLKGKKPPATLCRVVDSGIVCVLPKVRVAPVGATLRNLSRNLSLLPGRGEVRCSWHMSTAQPPHEDTETLDILLIPEPAKIQAKDFKANQDDEVPIDERHYLSLIHI